MWISELATRAGVGVETVRFYERQGLISQPPKPSDGGFRSYSQATAERIRFVRQAQDLGFSLKEIDALLSLRADPTTDCADVRERAQTKLEEVNNKIARLTAIQSALKSLIDACPGQGAVRSCSILEALEFCGTGETLRLKETKS
jgi:MerR family mercuric resistance operon transcriptional regulator